MAPRKTERIMNLTIALLSAHNFLTREQLRECVEGYHGLSDQAFERTFERDKDELRALGVPLETGTPDTWSPDVYGYRIRRVDFELPPIEFTAEEASALAVASRAWQEAELSEHGHGAIAKLRAAGLTTDSEAPVLSVLAPTLQARESAFEPLWKAATTRTRICFDYRGRRRTIEPWGLVSQRSRWYVVGFDRDREESRVFKLSRITGTPQPDSGPGAYTVPADVDLRALVRALEPPAPDGDALVALRGEAERVLGRQGRRLDAPPPAPAGGWPAGWTFYHLPYATRSDLIGELASQGANVLVIEPVALRERIRDHLAGSARLGDKPGKGSTDGRLR